MKRIAILSDTHGLLRPQVRAYLAGAHAILHAGDLDTPAVAAALQGFAPSYMVRGNNDGDWAQCLPFSLAFTLEGVRFFMVHDKKDVPVGLSGVDVVVYGHSHQYSAQRRQGVLWLNPGGCGRRRFTQPLTFCMMEAAQGRFRIQKIALLPPENG